MKEFSKIDASEIKIGMRFSSPIFFADGENMFLAENKTVKSYHIAAINRWNIQSLLTFGHEITDDDIEELDDVEDIEELDDLEEIEECEAV